MAKAPTAADSAPASVPSIEDLRATIAAAEKVMASHRLPLLHEVADHLAGMDVAGLKAKVALVLPTLTDEMLRQAFTNYANLLEQMGQHIGQVIVATQAVAGAK